MEIHLQFSFRDKERKASVYIDYKEQPCLIFVILKDKELIKEFGEEVTIKTDCENILPSDYSFGDLENLKEVIFHEVKHTIEFATIKAEYPKSQKWPSQNEANG